ncbi:MAG TPA: hypothetical protein VLK65_17125 [Vicinamibacteria bacterium]|nr:hypothetical protein [Vicinamibacteria bacterium]
MLESLSDLTLRLSQEISALEANCLRELAAAEKKRDLALLELGSAANVLVRYQKGLEKAKQVQFRAVQAADDARTREIQAAEEDRRERSELDERRHRNARQQALAKRDEAIRKAKAKWELLVDKARSAALAEQRRLRRDADDELERALEEAREKYNLAVEEARLERQSDLQDRLVEERMAIEAANRKAERLITGAAIAYERAVAQEEARMRNELSPMPEARRIQELHDCQLFEIRETCERAKEALFRQFTRDRRRKR